MDDLCDSPTCSNQLGEAQWQLGEDRSLVDPPRFCSPLCASNERIRRKYLRREGFDAQRATL